MVTLYRMDLERLPVDLVEILNKVTPNEEEQKKFNQFAKDKKDPKSLPDNDRFIFEVSHRCCAKMYISKHSECCCSTYTCIVTSGTK